jgi:hypothetical protein
MHHWQFQARSAVSITEMTSFKLEIRHGKADLSSRGSEINSRKDIRGAVQGASRLKQPMVPTVVRIPQSFPQAEDIRSPRGRLD